MAHMARLGRREPPISHDQLRAVPEAAELRNVLSGCSDAAMGIGLPAPHVQPQPGPATSTDPAIEQPAATQPTQPTQDCHPAYTPCLPDLPADALNCGDLAADLKPVTVNEVGVDPYRSGPRPRRSRLHELTVFAPLAPSFGAG